MPPVRYLDLTRLHPYPLAERQSDSALEDILVAPESSPPPLKESHLDGQIRHCARQIRQARERNATVMLMYGAHLVKNGGQSILCRLIQEGWVTHLATNGAGIIHDWEFAYQGWSTEDVRQNVAAGCFGTWDETSRYIHLALMQGQLEGDGLGKSVGRLIHNEEISLPSANDLKEWLRADPEHPDTPARADLLQAMLRHRIPAGTTTVRHPYKHASIPAQAYANGTAMSVHPGIGYDIISNHPIFNGAVLGRAAATDFALIGGSIDQLDGGVAMSVGSAIMAPQVFEKSLSCVHNLRFQTGRPPVQDHDIYVVDIQDGGQWDWTQGEPPKDNPAYYLRFCKSFSRMGGNMHYLCCDNILFTHQLYHALIGRL